jgi:hypothetical protein
MTTKGFSFAGCDLLTMLDKSVESAVPPMSVCYELRVCPFVGECRVAWLELETKFCRERPEKKWVFLALLRETATDIRPAHS